MLIVTPFEITPTQQWSCEVSERRDPERCPEPKENLRRVRSLSSSCCEEGRLWETVNKSNIFNSSVTAQRRYTVDSSQVPEESGTDVSINIKAIEAAAIRIEKHIVRTPVMTCEAMDEAAGRQLFFKCELFQKTGSFKARGACNAALLLPADCRDVVTHSSGNHAQALAWAAGVRGLRAHCVMPEDASASKVERVKALKGEVILCAASYGARARAADRVAREKGAVLVHSSNDAHVICGQGTVGLELIQQVRASHGMTLDAIIVPVGGGGLLAGVAVATRALCPGIRVIGAEPAAADDAYRSKAAGKLLQHDVLPVTLADGLRTVLGETTWPIVRDEVDCIITVTEEEIKSAMVLVYERMKLVIEPSAAVGVAAACGATLRQIPWARRVGVVLSGGNVDLSVLAQNWT